MTVLDMTAGAQRMAETDPHGWTLSLIAVTVVFSALLVLFCVYTLIGKLSQPKAPKAPKAKKSSGSTPDGEVAAAIAMALEAELGGELNAAIALALHLHLSNAVHDTEPGIITIAPRESAWGNPSLNFRKSPRK